MRWTLVLLLLPVAFAYVAPQSVVYRTDPDEAVNICATVFSRTGGTAELVCAGESVGTVGLEPGVPAYVCFQYSPSESTTCEWVLGEERAEVYVDVFPDKILSAVLAAILIFLVVRFAVRASRIK